MKKSIAAVLILISVLIVLLLPSSWAGAFAALASAKITESASAKTGTGLETGDIPTDIFLPTTYLQYYKLNEPYAICRYEEEGGIYVAVSHAGAIVFYKYNAETGEEQFKSVTLNDAPSSVGASSIAKYKNFLIFTQWSKICYADVSEFDSVDTSAQIKTAYPCSNSFSVFGDTMTVTTTEGIVYYDLSVSEEGNLVFTEKTGINYHYETNNPLSVLNSKDGKTYYYSPDAKAIVEYTPATRTSRIVAENLEGVKSIAENSGADDDSLYFSSNNGVFAITARGASAPIIPLAIVATDGEKDLGKLWNPKGICIVDDKLWVVDSDNFDKENSINAIQEIDIGTGEFTDFAITTNSKAVNRLTENAQDIVIDGDKIYALDDRRIVVINNIGGGAKERTYNGINLDSAVDNFCVSGDYIAYTTGNSAYSAKITVAKICRGEDENDPILTLDKLEISGSTLANIRIDDIAAMDGIFYFFGTRTTHPILYSLDLNAETLKVNELHTFDGITGSGSRITIDPFNSIYFSVQVTGGYELYGLENGKLTSFSKVITDKKLLSLQTDLDGKVYALYEGNLVECYVGGEKVLSKTITTSKNLGSIKPAVAMCLSCDSRYAYFIFEGLILRSGESAGLNISTPYTINIPSDFSMRFSKDELYGKMRKGAKLFEIKASELSSEFFAFKRFAIEDGFDDYAVKDLGGKYYLILKAGRAAIARKTDFLSDTTFGITSLDTTGYAITDFRVYALPVLKKLYVSDCSVKKYEKIGIIGEITFNDDDYFVVKTDDGEGLIPKTFVKDLYLSESEYSALENAYVYKKGGAAVYSEDLETQTDEIDSQKKVIVVSSDGEYTKIVYDGKVGYVNTDSIMIDSRNNLMKAAAIILFALSMLITTYYFEKRYLFRKGFNV